jgi:hypothetical protein
MEVPLAPNAPSSEKDEYEVEKIYDYKGKSN